MGNGNGNTSVELIIRVTNGVPEVIGPLENPVLYFQLLGLGFQMFRDFQARKFAREQPQIVVPTLMPKQEVN